MNVELVGLAPYAFPAGTFALFLLALKWGREDSRKNVDMANVNTEVSSRLRDDAVGRSERLQARVDVLEAEVLRLRGMLHAAGVDAG